MRTLEEILNEGTRQQRLRAVALIDNLPVAEELIREAYELGLEVGTDKFNELELETQATNTGLTQALEAKNATTIIVESKITGNAFLALLLCGFIFIELYRALTQ